jgi:hypothetical protein
MWYGFVMVEFSVIIPRFIVVTYKTISMSVRVAAVTV